VTADALDHVLEANGLSGSPVRDKLLALYKSLAAYPDAAQCLTALKDAGARTGILSNGSPKMLASAVKSAGIDDLLEHVISVEDCGIYKPHPSVYALATKRLGLEASRV
jgi:2-haloacid dehalogenase